MAEAACGLDFTLCIGPSGDVYGFGNNYRQQLGSSSFENATRGQVIAGLQGISAVACGPFHSVCLDSRGDVWTFGMKPFGRLGIHGSEGPKAQPQIIESVHNIVDIACGRHTLCLDADGHVWGFGLDTQQLGDYSQEPIKLPVENIRSIHAGPHISICCDTDYNLFVFETNIPVESSRTWSRESMPEKIPSFGELAQISVGRDHAMFLDSEGSVWGFSSNDHSTGNLTKSNNPTKIKNLPFESAVAVSCGLTHTMIVDNEHKLWTMGYNMNGQLGIGTLTSDTANFSSVVSLYEENPSFQLKDVEHIACGGYHTICKDTHNDVWACGRNNHGQLATGDHADVLLFKKLSKEVSDLFWVNKSHAKSARN